jgi:hypothetical protein
VVLREGKLATIFLIIHISFQRTNKYRYRIT